jgi:hypothetical protein
LAKLGGGVAVIRGGAPSESEMEARKEALGNAISATKAAAARAKGRPCSSTLNFGFESAWTSSGAGAASHINVGWIHWSPSATNGIGLRETSRVDGSRTADLRTLQMTSLGSGMLINSTVTGIDGRGAIRPIASCTAAPQAVFQVTGELDSSDLRHRKTLLGVEKSIDRGWSLYLVAAQQLYTSADKPRADLFDMQDEMRTSS